MCVTDIYTYTYIHIYVYMDLTSEIRKNIGDAIFKEMMVENFLELKYLHS